MIGPYFFSRIRSGINSSTLTQKKPAVHGQNYSDVDKKDETRQFRECSEHPAEYKSSASSSSDFRNPNYTSSSNYYRQEPYGTHGVHSHPEEQSSILRSSIQAHNNLKAKNNLSRSHYQISRDSDLTKDPATSYTSKYGEISKGPPTSYHAMENPGEYRQDSPSSCASYNATKHGNHLKDSTTYSSRYNNLRQYVNDHTSSHGGTGNDPAKSYPFRHEETKVDSATSYASRYGEIRKDPPTSYTSRPRDTRKDSGSSYPLSVSTSSSYSSTSPSRRASSSTMDDSRQRFFKNSPPIFEQDSMNSSGYERSLQDQDPTTAAYISPPIRKEYSRFYDNNQKLKDSLSNLNALINTPRSQVASMYYPHEVSDQSGARGNLVSHSASSIRESKSHQYPQYDSDNIVSSYQRSPGSDVSSPVSYHAQMHHPQNNIPDPPPRRKSSYAAVQKTKLDNLGSNFYSAHRNSLERSGQTSPIKQQMYKPFPFPIGFDFQQVSDEQEAIEV